MFVRLVELDAMGAQRQLATDLRPSFLKMPFSEAVAFWRERGGDPAILEEVLRAYRRRAATATDEQLDVISRRAVDELQRTLDTGSTLRDFSRAIDQQAITLGIAPADPSYLENVYRTNVASAYGAGRWQQMNDPDVLDARPYRQWFTARDNRVRAEHAPMQGLVWRADNPAFNVIAPPAGFQCFPGDVVVEGTFNAGLRAWYDGQIVEMTTESGRRLTVTPNHPIATVDGFVAAGAICEGQQLLAHKSAVELGVSQVDDEQAPAAIEQVFSAVMEAGTSRSVVLGPLDLHGDAKFCASDIDVVCAIRKLVDGVQPAASHDRNDSIFAPSDMTGSVGEARQGHLSASLDGLRNASGSGPRLAALPLNSSPVLLENGPLCEFRFGTASRLHASRFEHSPDGATRDTALVGELLLGSAGQVFLDKVVNVRRVPFAGHVYDLQSPYGWIVASGIVTSNCRCSLVTLSQEELEDEGLTVIDSIPAGFVMTPGFGASSFVR